MSCRREKIRTAPSVSSSKTTFGDLEASDSRQSSSLSLSARSTRSQIRVRQLRDREVDAHAERGARRGSVASARRASRQATRSTHSPSRSIRPDSSAMGMNLPGLTGPRRG